jgi:hypothetical protein
VKKSVIIIIIALGLICAVLVFLAASYTNNEVCGWEGFGKDWPCLCIGKKSLGLTDADETITTYYCTGVNLSCSDLILKLYKTIYPNRQSPVSCQTKKAYSTNHTEEITTCLEDKFTELDITQGEKDSRGEPIYVIQLHSREFLPQENAEQALKCFANLPEDRNYYAFAQFYNTPSDTENESIKSAGVEIVEHGYVSNRAWFVNVTKPQNKSSINKLTDLIRWVGVIRPKDKVYTEVWNGNFGGISISVPGTRLAIRFFDDVPESEAQILIESYNGEIIEKSDLSNKFYVQFAQEEQELLPTIKRMAEENKIVYIDEMPPPPTID